MPGGRFFDLAQFKKIIRLVDEYNINIVHSHDPKSNFYAFLISFITERVKTVATIHGWVEKSYKSKLSPQMIK